jgi:hypothetical protein
VAKVLVLVVGLVMFGLVAALIWYLANRFERAEERGAVRVSTWRPREFEAAGGRHVVIEHVTLSDPAELLETREVGVVEAGSDDAAERLADLRMLAQDRARTLNAQAKRS